MSGYEKVCVCVCVCVCALSQTDIHISHAFIYLFVLNKYSTSIVRNLLPRRYLLIHVLCGFKVMICGGVNKIISGVNQDDAVKDNR